MALIILHCLASFVIKSLSTAKLLRSFILDQDSAFLDLRNIMYKQHDYYDERGRINLAYDHDSESTLDLSTRYAHEASYYSRSYRNLPYQRGARSLTPQGTEPDTQSSCRKRIAVAVSSSGFHNPTLELASCSIVLRSD